MWEKDESLGLGGLEQLANAVADLHTQAVHLLPQTHRYSDAHNCCWKEGNTMLLWHMQEEQVTPTTLPAKIPCQPLTQKLDE